MLLAQSSDLGRPHVKLLLVGERLYLAGRDIRPGSTNPTRFPGFKRYVRGNHIEGVGEI